MNVKQVLGLIPEELLNKLTIETKVDYKVQKLEGVIVFKLLLYSMLQVKQNSLRVMEHLFNSYSFKQLIGNEANENIKFNSISDRLGTINITFFEELYKYCVECFYKEIQVDNSNVLRFDSTLITLSAKLIDFGFQSGGNLEHLKTLKFTMGYSDIVEHVDFYTEKVSNSENIALKQSILSCKSSKEKIVLFDRGIQARYIYDEFENEEILFVSRVNPNPKHQLIKENTIINPIETETLIIEKELIIKLINRYGKPTENVFRYIYAIQKETLQPIEFITNIAHLDAIEITELYKKRWDIEVLFKFLKQELNFSHLVSRSKNGIKVVLYSTLILSILLTVYKRKNNLKGFKMVKLKFAEELEVELIKHIVKLFGGNPDKMPSNFDLNKTFW